MGHGELAIRGGVARGQWWQHTRHGASCHLDNSKVLDPSGPLLPFISPPSPGFYLWGGKPSVKSRHQRRHPTTGRWPNSTSWVGWNRLDTPLQRKPGPMGRVAPPGAGSGRRGYGPVVCSGGIRRCAFALHSLSCSAGLPRSSVMIALTSSSSSTGAHPNPKLTDSKCKGGAQCYAQDPGRKQAWRPFNGILTSALPGLNPTARPSWRCCGRIRESILKESQRACLKPKLMAVVVYGSEILSKSIL